MKDHPAGVYAFSAPLLNGRVIQLDAFRRNVLLIVNTASQCGLTPQYAGLEQLHRAYGDRGFSVLSFPCNQFGRQEPGNARQIGDFCEENYGITFPVFAKIEVNGPNAHPLYRFLKEQKRGFLGMRRISWNFAKFLIDRDGNVVQRFPPSKAPAKIAGAIESLL
jgi:glutathione peroxidase